MLSSASLYPSILSGITDCVVVEIRSADRLRKRSAATVDTVVDVDALRVGNIPHGHLVHGVDPIPRHASTYVAVVEALEILLGWGMATLVDMRRGMAARREKLRIAVVEPIVGDSARSVGQ